MTQLLTRLRQLLWEEREALSRGERWGKQAGRIVFALVRDLMAGELSMRAMSLVYTTLLSIVPLLALAFSVLKALGVHNQLLPVLEQFFAPLGEKGMEISVNLVQFVENIKVGVLGSVGVVLLFYTAISLIQKVEASFNFIWRIARPRPLIQRVGEYLSVLTVGPVLVFAALGLTGAVFKSSVVTSIGMYEPFGHLIVLAGKLVPYVVIVGLFAFMYAFLPNTRVKLRPALAGGLAAGVIWQASSVIFASVVVSATTYGAIYSGFAIIIFLLIWFYVGWLVLLVGCQLAFYVQHPQYLKPQQAPPQLAGREAEYLSFMLMALVARRFMDGLQGHTQEELARLVDAPPEHVAGIVENLIQGGYLSEAGRTRTQLVPGRDLDRITLGELWQRTRAAGADIHPRGALGREAARLVELAESRFHDQAGELTLREWLTLQATSQPAPEPAPTRN